MKMQAHIVKKAICLISLLFSSISYSQNLNASTEPVRYMVKISDSAYAAIVESMTPKTEDLFSFIPTILNSFQRGQSIAQKAISLNSVYQNIDFQYKEMIAAMGVDNSSLGILTSPIENPKIKLLNNLQILIVESVSFDKNSLSNFSDIELIEKDKYFYLYGEAVDTKQTWTMDNDQLGQLLNFSTNSNKKTLLNNVKNPSTLEKVYGNFWALEAIQARKAWRVYNNQGKNTRVMVLDTGVDANHPDLINNFEKGRNFLPNSDSFSFLDTMGHGTHVAGTILGQVYGVAPKAKLLAAKVCGDSQGRCYSSAILEALDWAIEEKVDVLNLSLGGRVDKNQMFKAAYEAVARSGALTVAASGNSGNRIKNSISYPAGYSNVISVGSVKDLKGKFKRSPFSQYSSKLDIVAPGEEIISTVPLSSFKKTLTLYVQKSKEEEMSFEMATTLVVKAPNKALKSIEKAHLTLSTDTYVAGKFVLFPINEDLFNKKVFIDKLKSLERRGVLGIFFSGNSIYATALSMLLESKNFSFVYYRKMFSEGMAKKFTKAILNPKINLSFSIKIKKNIHYHKMTGTSMASPHVTGTLALSKSLKPSLVLKEARLLLHTSAKSIVSTITGEVGAGLVQASDLLSLIE